MLFEQGEQNCCSTCFDFFIAFFFSLFSFSHWCRSTELDFVCSK